MKNSTLLLKGVREPVWITKSEAINLKKIWADKSQRHDMILHIGKVSFSKGDIKFIEENPDKAKNDIWNDVMKDFYADEKEKRSALVKKTPEYKSNLLDMFVYLYRFATNAEPSKEILKKAQIIQLEFFIKNPQRTLCDIYLLKSIIPSLDKRDTGKMWDQSQFMLREAYFRLVEKAVFRDMQLSGQLKSDYVLKPLQEARVDETVEEMKRRRDINRKIDDDFNKAVKDAVDNF